MSNEQFKKFQKFMGGKGYYIALILCAVAIGISGYLYYRNAEKPNDTLAATQPVEAVATQPQQNVPVIATHPNEQPQQITGTQPQQQDPTLPSGSKPMKTGSPVEGQTVAVYAMDSLVYNQTTRDWRVHNGIDIAAEAGTKVRSAADGEVYTVYEDETMGTTVVIRHQNGYVTKYSSLSEASVKPGETVVLGQAIGCVGNTALMENALGDHVHFSVTHNDQAVDPAAFLSMK